MAAITEPIYSREATRPVCLWKENPYRLVSLLDIMRILHGDASFSAFALMVKIEEIASVRDPSERVPESRMSDIPTLLLAADQICEDANLPESKALIYRLRRDLKDPVTFSELRHSLKQLRELIVNEMGKRLFLSVSEGLRDYYAHEKPMGSPVYTAFPSARFDITQAGNCLACGCNVASAFHLMRAAEVALRELGRDRQIPLAKSGKIDFAEWGSIIRELEDAVMVIQQWTNRHSKEAAHKFYNSALVEIRSFNDGWRRHAAHVRPDPVMYDDEALALWGHVFRFMNTLAATISEGNYTLLVWP